MFDDDADLKAWLSGRPHAWASVLALRAALRVGVFIWPLGRPYGLNAQDGAVLQGYRALLVAHTACLVPDHDAECAAAAMPAYKGAARSASDRVAKAYASMAGVHAAAAMDRADADAAALYAAADAVRALSEPSLDPAVQSLIAARKSAIACAPHDADAFTGALFEDAQTLAEGVTVQALAASPLWRVCPERVGDAFERIRVSALRHSPYTLWLAWIRACVLGETAHTVIPINAVLKLCLESDAFWMPDDARTADQIMEAICEYAQWDWQAAEVEPLP